MKRPGPLLTLLAGLLVGVFMLSLNATTGTRNASSSPPTTATPTPTPKSSPAPSPSPSKTPIPDARYTGRTDDDSASVAVTLRGGKALAYYCDGRAEEAWLKGDVNDDGTMRLTAEDGSVLNGALKEGNRIRGTVDVGGGSQAFTADRATKPAGLYRATGTVNGTETDGGWIVQPDGGQVGILTRDGRPAPAPRLDPGTGAVTVDGQRLTARPATP